MEEIIQVEDRHYILATSPRADERSRVLKHGDAFAVFDRFGDVRPVGLGDQGLYFDGTRFLNRLTLRLHGRPPMLLSSSVREDNAVLAVDLTNADVRTPDGRLLLPRENVHLLRECFLFDAGSFATMYVRLRVRNFGLDAAELAIEIAFDSDFVDIFEVRGEARPRRGQLIPPRQGESWVELAYEGLDGVGRVTTIAFDPPPAELAGRRARLPGRVEAGGEREYLIEVRCEKRCRQKGGRESFTIPFVANCVANAEERRAAPSLDLANTEVSVKDSRPLFRRFGEALAGVVDRAARERADDAFASTSNRLFNGWLRRSAADLRLMITDTPAGPYPYAGIPWFNCPFGRDGIIAALQYLWVNPAPARGVLRYLAASQATELDRERDAEPGKIMHESRGGEMAALSEIPFGRYYGTVDATPLFVVLAGAYYDRTGDRATIEQLWPSISAALRWIDEHGDHDGDGFVEYSRKSSGGLVTQGWKDSPDSVFHSADDGGGLAEPPIALCEVQGYVYAAFHAAARLCDALNMPVEEVTRWVRRAEALQRKFDEAFWLDDMHTYALALDGRKRPCRVRASNAGHCLFTGIAAPDRAARVAHQLFDGPMFSGWGIRTVAAGEARYNPMSYHNGSVWPHDNAMIALGLSRYGLNDRAARVCDGMFAVAQHVDLQRLPELFCGFHRRSGEGPTLYPVACSPQTWAAGAVFMLLQACLGLEIDAPRDRVTLRRPTLPESVDELHIAGLRAARGSRLDLTVRRHGADVAVAIDRREGEAEVVVIK